MANLVDKRKLMLESNVLSIAVKLHIIANEFEELKGQLTLLIANLAGTGVYYLYRKKLHPNNYCLQRPGINS